SLIPAFPGVIYFIVDDHRSEAVAAFLKQIPEQNHVYVAFAQVVVAMTAGCFYMWYVLMYAAGKPKSHQPQITEQEVNKLAHRMAREAFGDLAQFKEYEVNELMLTYREMLLKKFLAKR